MKFQDVLLLRTRQDGLADLHVNGQRAQRLSKNANRSSFAAKEAENREARQIGKREGDNAERMTRIAHKLAGEDHLKAAEAHEEASRVAQRDPSPDAEEVHNHEESAEIHRAKAAEHAEQAGGEWDESKHPRDENGKFG